MGRQYNLVVKHYLELVKQDYFPANFESCDNYSGCLYSKICIADRLTRDWKLRSRFEKKDVGWDVGGNL